MLHRLLPYNVPVLWTSLSNCKSCQQSKSASELLGGMLPSRSRLTWNSVVQKRSSIL